MRPWGPSTSCQRRHELRGCSPRCARKRGLCYAVWASYQTFKDRASVLCYAGTTNERAQETLDVTLGELQRLQEGIEAEEVERVQAGLKSSLIMQEESTSARAGYAGLGLVLPRPGAQLRRDPGGHRRRSRRRASSLTCNAIRRGDFTIVTLGRRKTAAGDGLERCSGGGPTSAVQDQRHAGLTEPFADRRLLIAASEGQPRAFSSAKS